MDSTSVSKIENAAPMVRERQLDIAFVDGGGMPEPFRKANVAIHIASLVGALTLQQQKMFDAFIKNAARQMGQKDRIWFDYPMKRLMDDVGLNSNNREYVKDVINSLISTVVSWDHVNEKREWNSSGLLAGVRISGGVCHYTFADNMRQLLTKPEVYTNIDMCISKRFRRGHAYALWQNIVRYANLGATARHPVSKWRELVLGMDSHAGSYAQYKVFKSRVLLPSIAEINEVAEHAVELVEFHAGRSVSELQFVVRRKQSSAPEPPVERTEADVAPTLVAEVVALGMRATEARRLIGSFGRERVQLALQYTTSRMQRKHSPGVESAAAYFRKALAGGWGETDLFTNENGHSALGCAVHERVNARFEPDRLARAQEFFENLPPARREALVRIYGDLPSSAILPFRLSGRVTKAAGNAFYEWLAMYSWGPPADADADDLPVCRADEIAK